MNYLKIKIFNICIKNEKNKKGEKIKKNKIKSLIIITKILIYIFLFFTISVNFYSFLLIHFYLK